MSELISKGADVNIKNYNGETALFHGNIIKYISIYLYTNSLF